MKYRKKPLVIEAIKFEEDNIAKMKRFCDELICNQYNNDYYIWTLEGFAKIRNGDYIIKGVEGEFYPCNADIFIKSYDQVTGKNGEDI